MTGTIPRPKLVALANLAAFRARIPEADRKRLLAAVSDPSYTTTLVGAYKDHWGNCCPATQARLQTPRTLQRSTIRFASEFDRLMYRHCYEPLCFGRRTLKVTG